MRPLTIAQMLESDEPGGAELVMLRLAEELRSRGHRIVPVGPAVGVGWLGEKFRQAGFPWETFRLARPVDPGCVWRLGKMLSRQQVDLIQTHEFTMGVYGAAAGRLIRRPHVATMHGNEKMTAVWRRRAALRWAFRNSDAVVAVSQATRRSLETDLGLRSPSRIEVIWNGVPEVRGDRSGTRRSLGLREGEIMVFAAGSVVPRKGHLILLRALDALGVEGWRLVIAGWLTGEEPERIRGYIRERGLEERVMLLGQRDDIPDLLAASDLFAMPSLWEGLPLAILEAMLAEKPILATRCAGIPEALDHNVTGLLVPPGEVPAMSDALRPLIGDPALRARLARAARERALRDFTLRAMTDRYEARFTSILASRAR